MNFRHRRSIRLPGYDYSLAGAYYVTVCTAGRLCLFGEVQNGVMALNEIGQYVEKCWLDIPSHFPNVTLHDYVIMPNHVHGIIEIVGANNHLPLTNNHLPTNEDDKHMEAKNLSNRAKNLSPLRGTSKTVGSIIRGFKVGVTKYLRQNTEIYNVWQRNYYEHIIRDGNDHDRIAHYIQENPMNWEQDNMFAP